MVRTDPRRAGAVQRYHTWPTIQQQTVAEASWNVARILMMIWPDASSRALAHALMNDCGEIRSGDLPWPIKKDNPALRAEVVRIERESFQEQGIASLATSDGLDPIWRHRVKICDVLEMWEFGLEEMTLGNRYCDPIADDALQLALELVETFSLGRDDTKRIEEYVSWRRAKTPTRA